jgi:4-aminobutyrate aminotransferase-like enzyme/Ser/Thr protein kinase RdoA (MazF antagonist)
LRTLLALRSAPPVFGTAEAQRIARDVYGLAARAAPLSGERDCNFHIGATGAAGHVLKIVDGAALQAATDCQTRVLRHLAEQDPGLPVPRLVTTLAGADLGSVDRDGISYATCLLTYIPGVLLRSAPPSADLLGDVGRTLARIDVALQGFFHPALDQHIAWDVRRLPELLEHAPYLEPAARRRVEGHCHAFVERLPELRALRSQAVHGDCHPGNLLVDSTMSAVCGVLDFGDMIHAPLILEPAVAMSELLTEGLCGPEGLARLLSGYAGVHPVEAREVDWLHDLIAARHSVTLLVHAWRSRHDPTGARLLDEAARNAIRSLERLEELGRARLNREWREAAGVSSDVPEGLWLQPEAAPDLARRHRLMGAGAELFYEEPLHLVRGEGVWLFDPQGRAYLDMYNNVPHVGHCHPTVVGAIQRQTATLVTHTRYLHHLILEYAEQLTSRCPKELDACIFVNSGSEANDVAWRLAQFATANRGAVVMAHAYHGITDAVAALTPGAGEPLDPRVVTLTPPPFGLTAEAVMDEAEVAAAARDAAGAVRKLAARGFGPEAFFIDSALTSSGIVDPPPMWAAAIASALRTAGCLIVADEVQYGLGRSGSHFWGFERRGFAGPGLTPDIVTLGKPVGNGYPIGVVIANRALIEAFQAKYGFFSTFGGNPVAAAAGLAVLQVLEREQLMANARTTGAYLRQRLQALAERHACLGRVRGHGLLQGLEVLGPDERSARTRTKQIVNRLASRHRVLIGSEGPAANILKLRPPMPFCPEHVDLAVDAIDAAAASA